MPVSGRARDRDAGAFGKRAHDYDEGWRGRMHHQIADRTADLALTCVPAPKRILDAGCGTGYLLGRLAARAPQAQVPAGIDAAPAMIQVARAAAADDRLRFVTGTAERLPWPAGSFDLVVSTTSFDHWADQRAGLAQCARVLAPGGCLVLADQFSALLLPTLLAGRRGKARTRGRAAHLLTAAGLHSPQWHRLHAVIIQAVTATKNAEWRYGIFVTASADERAHVGARVPRAGSGSDRPNVAQSDHDCNGSAIVHRAGESGGLRRPSDGLW
jgi:ubiquinone/menaquinone biosynthesis C-methylase UbiE